MVDQDRRCRLGSKPCGVEQLLRVFPPRYHPKLPKSWRNVSQLQNWYLHPRQQQPHCDADQVVEIVRLFFKLSRRILEMSPPQCFGGTMFFYEQDKNCTAVQSTLLCSSSSEKWGQQHDTTDYDYVIMTTILYKWNDDVIVEWICECVIRIPYEQVLQHSWGGPASSCPCLPPAFNWYILISRRHFEQNLQEYKKRPVEHWPNQLNAS